MEISSLYFILLWDIKNIISVGILEVWKHLSSHWFPFLLILQPHVDGPLFYPTITTITLGSHTLLDLYLPLPSDLEGDQTHICNRDQDQSSPHTQSEQKDQSGSCSRLRSSAFSERYVGSLLLEPRSLLIIQEDLYTSYLHGIGEVKEDVVSEKIFNRRFHQLGDMLTRNTRISLTIRHVPRVLKSKLIFGKSR